MAFERRRDIPRDDLARPNLSQQTEDHFEMPVGTFHPVARAVIERGVKIAFFSALFCSGLRALRLDISWSVGNSGQVGKASRSKDCT